MAALLPGVPRRPRRATVRGLGASADRLRALLPRAIDTLAEALDTADGAERVNVALAVLKLAGPLPLAPTGPTDPEEIVRIIVEQERECLRTRSDDSIDSLMGKPEYNDHLKSVRKRLARLAPPDADGAESAGQ